MIAISNGSHCDKWQYQWENLNARIGNAQAILRVCAISPHQSLHPHLAIETSQCTACSYPAPQFLDRSASCGASFQNHIVTAHPKEPKNFGSCHLILAIYPTTPPNLDPLAPTAETDHPARFSRASPSFLANLLPFLPSLNLIYFVSAVASYRLPLPFRTNPSAASRLINLQNGGQRIGFAHKDAPQGRVEF